MSVEVAEVLGETYAGDAGRAGGLLKNRVEFREKRLTFVFPQKDRAGGVALVGASFDGLLEKILEGALDKQSRVPQLSDRQVENDDPAVQNELGRQGKGVRAQKLVNVPGAQDVDHCTKSERHAISGVVGKFRIGAQPIVPEPVKLLLVRDGDDVLLRHDHVFPKDTYGPPRLRTLQRFGGRIADKARQGVEFERSLGHEEGLETISQELITGVSPKFLAHPSVVAVLDQGNQGAQKAHKVLRD